MAVKVVRTDVHLKMMILRNGLLSKRNSNLAIMGGGGCNNARCETGILRPRIGDGKSRVASDSEIGLWRPQRFKKRLLGVICRFVLHLHIYQDGHAASTKAHREAPEMHNNKQTLCVEHRHRRTVM